LIGPSRRLRVSRVVGIRIGNRVDGINVSIVMPITFACD
jgi:hypothetical protein